MSGKILAPLDFSEVSDTVVSWATQLARDSKRSLILLHVQELSSGFPYDGYNPIADVENPELRKMLEDIQPTDKSVPCELQLILGIPSHQIVQTAMDEKVDLIVMGSHGRKGVSRFLMGSVAEAVLRYSPCPVLVVKEPVKVQQDKAAEARTPMAKQVS